MKLTPEESAIVISSIKETGKTIAFICRKYHLQYNSFWSWINGRLHHHAHDGLFRHVLVKEIGAHLTPHLYKQTNYEIKGRLS